MVHIKLELEFSADRADAKETIDKIRQGVREIRNKMCLFSLEGKWVIHGEKFDFYLQTREAEAGIENAIYSRKVLQSVTPCD